MCKYMTLKGLRYRRLDLLNSLVCSTSASSVRCGKWCNVDFSLNQCVIVISLATTTRTSALIHVTECQTYPSLGPVIVQTTDVLPIVTRLLPSLAGCVEIEATMRRSSFHRRPSCLSSVCEYVETVSSGILTRCGRFVVYTERNLHIN